MLDSPKWQIMWMESQQSSKGAINVTLPSQSSKKILEDLRASCTSSNKVVQLEALKCWGIYIKNQNLEDWKINAVCYTAVRPLLTKKIQPLHKDSDVCKLKLNLLWNLIVKVQSIMQLEGPQYILEVFLQSCLTWLSEADGVDNEISVLILNLLLALFKVDEDIVYCDKEMFPSLSVEIFKSKKLFHVFIDKLLGIFISWKKVKDKKIMLKIWKCLLEHCEDFHEIIPTPIWHKIFKIVGQICSEGNENLKDKIAFLHGCATTLRSVLCSSKFIDFGNLLTTPCEALLKKLMDLCTFECEEFIDYDMFILSQEITQVLSDESVAIGGYDLCIFVLDLLEEFALKSLYWGVWCGLVACYRMRLLGIEKSQFSKIQKKFFRKLRSVSVNFDLDKNYLHKDCINEVKRNIELLNIDWLCATCESVKNNSEQKHQKKNFINENRIASGSEVEKINDETSDKVLALPNFCYGKFSTFHDYFNQSVPIKTISIKFGLMKDILKTVDVKSLNPILDILYCVRFITLKRLPISKQYSCNSTIEIHTSMSEALSRTETKTKIVPAICYSTTKSKKSKVLDKETNLKETNSEVEDVVSAPRTRSRKRAEEEKMKKDMEENQKRRKRKSFESLVQEIVKKNKLRKTEKITKKKNSMGNNKDKLSKKKTVEKIEEEKENSIYFKKALRNSKKEESKNCRMKSNDGKLENYFEVIQKKLDEKTEQTTKVLKSNKNKKKSIKDSKCCEVEKDSREQKEMNWKQTSLKTKMSQEDDSNKLRHSLRIRNQTNTPCEGSPKAKKGKKTPNAKNLANSSPFKEVLHDHEYAKMPPDLITSHVIKGVKDEINKIEEDIGPVVSKPIDTNPVIQLKENKIIDVTLESKMIKEETEIEVVEVKRKTETTKNKERSQNLWKNLKVDVFFEKEKTKSKVTEIKLEKTETPRKEPVAEVFFETEKSLQSQKSEVVKEDSQKTKHIDLEEVVKELDINLESKNSKMGTTLEEVNTGEISENQLEKSTVFGNKNSQVLILKPEENLSEESKGDDEMDDQSPEYKKGKRKLRVEDNIYPNKKIKLISKEEMKVKDCSQLDFTEKENIEVVVEEIKLGTSSPPKEVSKVKNDEGLTSPRGNMSSRALRMIALVPESTKPEQIHWEPTNKQEVVKCKKPPNVDKYSRASKMLALLSENAGKDAESLEVEDSGTITEEENGSEDRHLVTTPNIKTPVSTLKSPNSVKKRRSIRFDDTKNETVVYKTDTPPCQVLEEKEKCRRVKLQ